VSTSIDEEKAEQPNITTANSNPTDNNITTATVSDSVIAANDSTQPSANVSHSLSASLANTRRFVTEITELLDKSKPPPKKGNKAKLTARVLTSAESLALLIEKEKRRKRKRRKAKRKEERERKRQEKEEESRIEKKEGRRKIKAKFAKVKEI